MTVDMLLQSTITGISMGLIYTVLALGLVIMFSVMNIINFAHGAIYMLGAYGIFYFFHLWGVSFPAALILTIVLLGLLGVLVERLIYRPTSKNIYAVCVALLGLTILIESIAWLIFGIRDKHVPALFTQTIQLGNVFLPADKIAAIGMSLPFIASLFIIIYKTKFGRAMRAIEQNREAAALKGVNIGRVNAFVFGLGFLLAGVAGGLVAPLYIINPSIGGSPLLKAFIIIIIGGMGSFPGAILGGLLIGLVDSIVGTAGGADLAYLVSYAAIILILWVKPTGLLGNEQ
ncbi:branched-chain amino acid ABC transporter permease [Chloroflexota bacterium]